MLDTSQGDCPHVFLDVNANLHLHVFSHAGSIFRMALIKSKWFLPVSSAISSDVMCWLSFPTCVVFFIEINVVIIILSCFCEKKVGFFGHLLENIFLASTHGSYYCFFAGLACILLQGNPCGGFAGWRLLPYSQALPAREFYAG